MQGKKKKIDVHQWGTQRRQYLQIFGEKKKIENGLKEALIMVFLIIKKSTF